MPLLLLDLDNTLIDRDAAFRAAATELLTGHGLPVDDVGWIETIDNSGYAARAEVLDKLVGRYDSRIPYETLRDFVHWGAAGNVEPDTTVNLGLRAARVAGWTPVVVTNGHVAQQTAKLRNAGLDQEVAGWVISEAVGHRKPGQEIFDAAAACVDADLDGAWMIGDALMADIGGAAGLGLRSVWLRLGRDWPADLAHRPDHMVDDVAAAIELALDAAACD